MRFVHPQMAVWLLALPATALLCIVHSWYRHRSRRGESIQPRFAAVSRRSRYRRDIVVGVLACVAVLLLVGAAARPQLLYEHRAPEYERQDLVVILDRSVSMRARDVTPSRAERAVAELRIFLQRKPEEIDRVGLVGFAATPLVLSYLTRDVNSLLFYLDWLKDDPTILYGTDIGSAVSSALDVAARDKQPGRKLFLIISDGDDDGSTLASAVATARQRGIRVHCIGIGSPDAALIPISRAAERDVFLRDDNGSLVKTRFNEASLRAVATATSGRYLRSQTSGDVLAALDSVVRADRRRIGTRTIYAYLDVHRVLLAGALAAVALLVATA
ncbi:MAG: vWA domain-containing protein [Vicinamibacterales bacterium]